MKYARATLKISLLMRCRERRVSGDRKLARRFDRGRAAAEIEQQILYGSCGHTSWALKVTKPGGTRLLGNGNARCS